MVKKDKTKIYGWKKSKYCQICGKESDVLVKVEIDIGGKIRDKIFSCRNCITKKFKQS